MSDQVREHMFNIRLTIHEKRTLDAFAAKHGITKAGAVRMLLLTAAREAAITGQIEAPEAITPGQSETNV
ncbi:MAG: hypothetical protein JW862_02690 [Anaerolineales bacterium]|nr:hypothetical protein [Anaerolineales bacterium]